MGMIFPSGHRRGPRSSPLCWSAPFGMQIVLLFITIFKLLFSIFALLLLRIFPRRLRDGVKMVVLGCRRLVDARTVEFGFLPRFEVVRFIGGFFSFLSTVPLLLSSFPGLPLATKRSRPRTVALFRWHFYLDRRPVSNRWSRPAYAPDTRETVMGFPSLSFAICERKKVGRWKGAEEIWKLRSKCESVSGVESPEFHYRTVRALCPRLDSFRCSQPPVFALMCI